MRGLVAGVDSSTQSCTVVLRDLETGRTVSVARSPHPPTTPPVSEQHPDAWWQALGEATRGATSNAHDGDPTRSAIAAVSIAAQAHGFVPLDDTGEVIRPAKLWNDTTSAPEARALIGQLDAAQWAYRAGSVPPPAFTISKVAWLARHEPEHFAALRTILLPHDWLTYRLTGEYLTDPSDASGTGYFTPATGAWDTELLGLVDPARDWPAMLPRILGHDESAGHLTADAAAQLGPGYSQATLVGPGAADNQAAALGMGLEPGDVVFSLGTSGVVMVRTGQPVHDRSGAVNGNADAAGGFLPIVCTLNAAKVTDTVARLLGVTHDELTALALSAPLEDPRRPVLAAFLDGERVPDRPAASGTLTGLRTDTTRAQIARAGYEGVLAGLVHGLKVLEELGVPTGGRLAVTGGGARSAAYRQLLADLTGRCVYTVDQPEAPAAGAAIQAAAVATGTGVAEVIAAWAPAWTQIATPRSDTDPDRLMSRYEAVASWSDLG